MGKVRGLRIPPAGTQATPHPPAQGPAPLLSHLVHHGEDAVHPLLRCVLLLGELHGVALPGRSRSGLGSSWLQLLAKICLPDLGRSQMRTAGPSHSQCLAISAILFWNIPPAPALPPPSPHLPPKMEMCRVSLTRPSLSPGTRERLQGGGSPWSGQVAKLDAPLTSPYPMGPRPLTTIW